MPIALDFTQRIINISWGEKDVIVIFVDVLGIARSTFEPIEDEAESLGEFAVSIDGDNVTTAAAYKVGRDAGEFMKTTAPAIDGGGFFTQVGHAIYVFIFAAIGDEIESGLARAKAGTALAYESAINEYRGDQPADKADPPGLLWSIGLNHVPISRQLTWKIRYGAHRPGDDEEPLPDDEEPMQNDMVQCYPLSGPWTLAGNVEYTGYTMRIYRLDKDGTGQSYGTSNPDNSFTGTASIDPIWHQEISSGGNNDSINHGIPFADPPPLIATDVPNAIDHS